MGLFDGKTTTTVASVTYNIAGDAADRPNFLKQALIFLTAAEQSIGEKLPRMYMKSLGVKLKRAYAHAASLPQGLPTASVQLWEYQEFIDAVQALLDSDFAPGRYNVEDAYLTEGGTAPVIETYLNNTYGWDSITGLMATPPAGFDSDANVVWYLKPGEQILDEPEQFDDLFDTLSTFEAPKQTLEYTIEFRHLAATPTADLVVTVILDSMNASDESLLMALVSEWLQTVRSDTTITRAFLAGDVDDVVTSSTTATAGSRVTITTTVVTTDTDGVNTTIRTKITDATTSEAVSMQFQLGTGDYPTLDALWLSRANVEQTYFPSIPFRIDNVDMLDEKYKESAQYKEREKIVSLMGMDAVQIQEMINTNPSIKDIDYAFLQAGANMNTESQAEMDYLFRFWEMCMGRQTATEADLTAWEALGYENKPKPMTNSLVIKDPQSLDGAYKVTIEWDYIKKTTVTGTLSPTARINSLDIVAGTGLTYEYTSIPTRSMMDSTVISIRKQINLTQYEVIEISGAIHKNDVYKGKTVETLAKDARAVPADNEGFLIPIHMGLFATMPLAKRTQLAQECMYMVFNSYVKTKQKWYQTGIFKVILAIIGIALIYFSFGSLSIAVQTVWINAAAIIGISGAVLFAVVMFTVGYLSSYLIGKWSAGFESVFGKKWSQVAMAIVAIIVSTFAGGGFGTSQGWLKTAVQIIDIASQLFTAYVRGATVVMRDEYDAFVDKVEEERKKLEKLSDEFFGPSDLVSVDYLLQLQKTLREDSPTTFLARTLITGSDVVDFTLGQISEMVYLSTTPRLQGTL